MKIESMLTKKTKIYRVVLSADAGGYDSMTIVGCANELECIKFVNKSKGKEQSIKTIKEIASPKYWQ